MIEADIYAISSSIGEVGSQDFEFANTDNEIESASDLKS